MDLSVRETEAQVKQLLKEKTAKDQEQTNPSSDKASISIYIKAVEKDLSEHLGRKVKIAHGKRKGKVELEYYGQDDLNSLLSFLERKGESL